MPNEFLLVLSDGDPPVDVDDLDAEPKPRREKGAYYKNIERKMHLKKKRVNVSAFCIVMYVSFCVSDMFLDL